MPPVDAGPRAGWAMERATKAEIADRHLLVAVVLLEKGVAALPVRVRLAEMVAVLANRPAGLRR